MTTRNIVASPLGAVPHADGVISRLACARAKTAGIALPPLLKKANLTVEQIDDSRVRLAARDQIRLLNLVADALRGRPPRRPPGSALRSARDGTALLRACLLRDSDRSFATRGAVRRTRQRRRIAAVHRRQATPDRIQVCRSQPSSRPPSVRILDAAHRARASAAHGTSRLRAPRAPRSRAEEESRRVRLVLRRRRQIWCRYRRNNLRRGDRQRTHRQRGSIPQQASGRALRRGTRPAGAPDAAHFKPWSRTRSCRCCRTQK